VTDDPSPSWAKLELISTWFDNRTDFLEWTKLEGWWSWVGESEIVLGLIREGVPVACVTAEPGFLNAKPFGSAFGAFELRVVLNGFAPKELLVFGVA